MAAPPGPEDEAGFNFPRLCKRPGRLRPAKLAGFVRQAGIDNTTTIRLLSCSSLESAKVLSRALGSRPLLATDGLVRVHDDGGITILAKIQNEDTRMYKLKEGQR